MADLWTSQRLRYRAIEDDDEAFISTLSADAEAYLQQMPFLPIPAGTKSAKKSREWYEEQMMSAIICLPPSTSSTDPSSKPEPVGVIFLFAQQPRQAHHRNSEIGLGISRAYQGQGYGSEAIKWALDFGFRRAGLHRIGISAFEYNSRAIRLYERLGFVHDSKQRDKYWHDGRFWDEVGLSMLEDEWRERYKREK